MHYQYRGQKSFIKKHQWILLLLPLLLIVAGAYLLILLFSLRLQTTSLGFLVGATKVQATSPDGQDYIVIPKINAKVAIVTGDSEAILSKGAWHRFPEHGDPTKGGNFIVAAHRFYLGLTPQLTRARSPFYNLDKLKPGDPITVLYKGKTYTYHVTRSYSVAPTSTEIEDASSDTKLTLYTCTLKGSADGRVVVEAAPAN